MEVLYIDFLVLYLLVYQSEEASLRIKLNPI